MSRRARAAASPEQTKNPSEHRRVAGSGGERHLSPDLSGGAKAELPPWRGGAGWRAPSSSIGMADERVGHDLLSSPHDQRPRSKLHPPNQLKSKLPQAYDTLQAMSMPIKRIKPLKSETTSREFFSHLGREERGRSAMGES
ncbi:hypothetical protein ACLOJK_029059 [Asimina triloba]